MTPAERARVRLFIRVGGYRFTLLTDGAWGLRLPLGLGFYAALTATERGIGWGVFVRMWV